MHSLLDEINRLALPERIQLVEDLWDSVALQATALPISDRQREELDRRLALHQQNPAGGVSLDTIADKLGISL